MELKDYINVKPRILTIIPTHKCTAACDECCFRCTPQVETIMDYHKIERYIDEAIDSFPNIEIVVFTGGEPFLLDDKLPLVIKRVASHKRLTRVVTNGYWASSYENAIKKLTPLKEAGLTEINFSTGDNHQKFISIDNIVYGTKAAYNLGVRPICISVESPPTAQFKTSDIYNDSILSPMIEEGTLLVLNAAWMTFKTNLDNNNLSFSLENLRPHTPCHNLYENIVINPYSQMLACCGLTVEYNEYLKLGSLADYSIANLYYQQYEDLFKFWLYVDGPEYIYEKIMSIRGIKKDFFPHECAYCVELVRNQENISILKRIMKQELSGIIYRYEIRKKKLIV
ncbi:MAG: radical SAM protein [Bacteroidales bacterium]|nr:radical SAM protein [Bacteroidales bacterium]